MGKAKKKDPAGGRPRSGTHGVHQNWVRTGGLIGDDSMHLMNKFQEEGAGVDESNIKDCGEDPNSDLELHNDPGSEP